MATASNTAPNTSFPGPTGRSAAQSQAGQLAARIERTSASAIRYSLYLVLFLVPLLITSPDAMFGYADVPKIAAVRILAGLIAIGWLVHFAAGVAKTGTAQAPTGLLRGRNEKWIAGAVTAYLFVALASSVVSVSQKTAFFGAYPGFDSTDLYSMSSYILIGAAAARFLRTRRYLEIALWSIALAGGLSALYGIAQFAGLDPLRFDRFEVNDGRSPLTFGNPSFAGSFLTISLFASIGIYFLQKRPISPAGLLAFAIISLQVAALVATASRGAWVGAVVGAMTFAILAFWIFRDSDSPKPWRHIALLGIPLVAALFGGLALVSVGSGSSAITGRIQSFNGDLLDSGLNGRQATWTATLELIGERPWVEGESSNAPLRHLLGYGPDTYRYGYQLVAPDEHVDRFVPYAHNSFLNIATELGIAGLVAWTVLSVAVVVTGVSLARNRSTKPWIRLTSAAIIAALVAHGADQLANVPRAADSLSMWTLIGMVVALAGIAMRAKTEHKDEPTSVTAESKKQASAVALAIPAVAVIAIAVVAGVTILANAGHVMADRAAATLQSEMIQGALVSDLSATADRASGLAGDVAYYHSLEAEALNTASQAISSNPSLRQGFARRSLDAKEAAASAIPLSPTENLTYAAALSRSGRIAEAVERYELAVRLSPRYWAAWLELAGAYAAVDRIEEGKAALGRAAELISHQADVTRYDEVNLKNFAAVELALRVGQL